MFVGDITQVLPHRYPMLLLDRISEVVPYKHAVGYKNLTANEAFFQGHFPGQPIMPGVYMIEALAQLGGTLILGQRDFGRRIAVLAGIDKAKFRRPVVPGDRLDMEVNMLRHMLRGGSSMGWVKGEARVEGKLACSAELMFSVSAVARFTLDASILHE
jgi:3-hydroxyacyl-[acyl-carrier-protein] dehydratase